MKYKRSEAKEWAGQFFKGLECILLPSFTPEDLSLDEAGIRHDVRELIQHGCFSIALLTEVGTTFDEDKLIAQWCADEAAGRVGINVPLRYNTPQQNLEMAQFARDIGCDSVLLRYPPTFQPKSQQEVYDYTKAVCEGTDLAVVLFPSTKNLFPFPAGGFPAPMLSRMADIENVVAMKAGLADYTWLDECFRVFGDKILISYPHDDGWAILIRNYGMQWSGSGLFHIFQTREDQREIRLFKLFQDGTMGDALELYWKMDPWRKAFQKLHVETYRSGGLYHFEAWKYAEGLLGMTGGLMREPKLTLFPEQRDRIRQAMQAVDLKISVT